MSYAILVEWSIYLHIVIIFYNLIFDHIFYVLKTFELFKFENQMWYEGFQTFLYKNYK